MNTPKNNKEAIEFCEKVKEIFKKGAEKKGCGK